MSSTSSWFAFAAATVAVSAACSSQSHSSARPAEPMAAAPAPARVVNTNALPEVTAFVDPGADVIRRPVFGAVAVLRAADGRWLGTVEFAKAQQGLDVTTKLMGMPPGEHAYHIHVYGDCSSPDLKSAGPHFHFTGSSFDQSVKMITGNIGEVQVEPDGRAEHRTRLPFARLHGPMTILGRSVVIHAQGNDPNVTPDGGAGARIACGVIGIANPVSEDAPISG